MLSLVVFLGKRVSEAHFRVQHPLFFFPPQPPLLSSKEAKPILSSVYETKYSLESKLLCQTLSYNSLLQLREKPLKEEPWLVGMTAPM